MAGTGTTLSGDATLTVVNGVGYVPGDGTPAAFKSLAELVIFFELKAPSALLIPGPFHVYSFNSVSPHIAVCACWNDVWQLYMATESAHNGWYYLNAYLKTEPPAQPGAGPVVEGLKTYKFVAIRTSVSQTYLGTAASPDMTKLTEM